MSYSNTSNVTAPRCSATEIDSSQVKALKTILYSIVMLVACFGNIFIITVVYKTKQMRKTTNIFIANMAASDMFIAVFSIPRILSDLHNGSYRWLIHGTLGVITCKFCHFFGDISFCISILSHTAIAVDRFYAIVHSLRPSPITPSRRKYIILLIWLFALALNCPSLYPLTLTYRNGKAYCLLNWDPLPATTQKIYLTIIVFTVIFCFPTSIIIILYTRLVKSILCKKDVSLQTSQVRKRQKEDVIVLRKVAVLVTLFFFSVTPFISLLMLTLWLWGSLPCSQSAWTYSFIAFFLLMSNSATNPSACIILSKSYRRNIRRMINSWRRTMPRMSRSSENKKNSKTSNSSNGGRRGEQNIFLDNIIRN